jgi:transposase
MYIRKLIQKNKNGKERIYLQLVKSYREGEKVKQKLIANIGRLDELLENGDIETFITDLSRILEEEKGKYYVDVTNELSCEDVFEYGMPYLISALWNRTGLKNILVQEFEKLKGKDRAEREVEAIFEMVLARLTDPKSKLATFNEWRDKYYFGEEELLSETLDLHDYYRAMDTLSETLEHIEESLFFERRNLFSSTELVFFDTTSTYFEGEGEEDGIGKYGFSKDHRGDRKQVVISLVVDEHKIPITHKVWEGNTVDKKAFSETVKELKSRFGVKRAVLVADRGCVSREIIEALVGNNLEYIVGMKMNLIEVKEVLKDKGEYSKVSDNLYVKEVKVDNKRYIVCFNPEEATHEKEKRANIITHLKEVTNVKNFIPNRDIKKLIKLESNRISINEEKVEELEEYDGKWVLLTNTALSVEEAAERYKELWKIEDSFETMKTFLKIRPIYHYRERRIKAHIALVFLALYSERILENLLGNDWNFRRIYNAAQSLKLVKLKADSEQYLMRTELKEETKLLIRNLQMQFPKRLIRL